MVLQQLKRVQFPGKLLGDTTGRHSRNAYKSPKKVFFAADALLNIPKCSLADGDPEWTVGIMYCQLHEIVNVMFINKFILQLVLYSRACTSKFIDSNFQRKLEMTPPCG